MKEPYKTYLYIGLICSLILGGLYILLFTFAYMAKAEELINEDFEEYNYGLLYNQSQNKWFPSFGSDSSSANIEGSPTQSGVKALSATSTGIIRTTTATTTSDSYLSFYVYQKGDLATADIALGGILNATDHFLSTLLTICNLDEDNIYFKAGGTYTLCTGGSAGETLEDLSGGSKEYWHYIEIDWITASTYKIRVNGSTWSSTKTTSESSGFGVAFRSSTGVNNPIFDSFGNYNNNIDTTTRINWLEPATSTPSNTFNVEFEYYLNSTDADIYTNILAQVCPLSYTTEDECVKGFLGPLTTDTLTTNSIEITTIREGFSLGLISFWNGVLEDETCPWWKLWCEDVQVLIGPSDSNSFNVATTTISADVPTWITDFDCSTSFTGIIDGALCNVALFLFNPSEEATQRFATLQQDLNNKIPFGFFFSVKNKLDEIASTTSSVGADVVVDVGMGSTTIFSFTGAKTAFDNMGMGSETVQNIFRWIMWLTFASYIFMRITTGIIKSENAV